MSSNTWLVSDLARLAASSKLCICTDWLWYYRTPEPWFNIKMLPYQYRKSHCGDKTILWSSYLHSGISYIGNRLLYIELEPRSQIWGYPLQWHHNERNGVSNHQPHDCLLKHLLRRRSKKTSKLCVTGLCAGNSPVTSEIAAQRASNAENVSSWWRHHSFAIRSSSVVAAHSRSFLGGFSKCFSCMEFSNIVPHSVIPILQEHQWYLLWQIPSYLIFMMGIPILVRPPSSHNFRLYHGVEKCRCSFIFLKHFNTSKVGFVCSWTKLDAAL